MNTYFKQNLLYMLPKNIFKPSHPWIDRKAYTKSSVAAYDFFVQLWNNVSYVLLRNVVEI